MKTFAAPEMDVQKLAVEDVITTSPELEDTELPPV